MDYTPYLEAARAAASRDPAHDLLHVQRVFANAKHILRYETADATVVLTAILLHELFNYPKGHPESKMSGDVCAERAAQVLAAHDFPAEKREAVLECIRNHSFSKGVIPDSIEGKIVQDADRLDAIGSIGIARCFASCSEMERPFYDATDPFCTGRVPDDKQFGIDHFYIKLFRLAEGMHTTTAKEMAQERTEFMHVYLAQLKRELAESQPDA